MSKQFATFAGDKLRISTNLPSPGITDAYSVALWVKWNSASAVSRPCFYRFNNTGAPFLSFGLNSSGVLHLAWDYGAGGSAGLVDGASPAVSTWHHVAVTMNSRVGCSYLNGVLQGTSTESSATPLTTNDMLMLGHNDTTDGLTGLCSIQFARVWTQTALSLEQVQAEMYSPVAVLRDGLWGDWPLRNGADFYDVSGNGNDWTLTGTTTDVDPDTVELWEPAPRRRVGPAAAAAARVPNKVIQLNQSLFAVY